MTIGRVPLATLPTRREKHQADKRTQYLPQGYWMNCGRVGMGVALMVLLVCRFSHRRSSVAYLLLASKFLQPLFFFGIALVCAIFAERLRQRSKVGTRAAGAILLFGSPYVFLVLLAIGMWWAEFLSGQ